MSWTGLNLEMYFFHFKLRQFRCLRRSPGQATGLHIFGTFGKALPSRWDCGLCQIQNEVQKFQILVMMVLGRKHIRTQFWATAMIRSRYQKTSKRAYHSIFNRNLLTLFIQKNSSTKVHRKNIFYTLNENFCDLFFVKVRLSLVCPFTRVLSYQTARKCNHKNNLKFQIHLLL
jgi:hypothetical protein